MQDPIERIERELGVKLQASYRTVWLACRADPGHADDCDEFYNRPERVIEENQAVRREGFFGERWPENYLVIGEDGCGNYYCLDLRQEASPVHLADHESTAGSGEVYFEVQSAGLEAFLGDLKEQWAELEQAEREGAERRKNKKWWQFWI